MSRRASNFRSKLKERLRPVVNFGYGFRTAADSNKDMKHNRRLVKTLRPDTFHTRVCPSHVYRLILIPPNRSLNLIPTNMSTLCFSGASVKVYSGILTRLACFSISGSTPCRFQSLL